MQNRRGAAPVMTSYLRLPLLGLLDGRNLGNTVTVNGGLEEVIETRRNRQKAGDIRVTPGIGVVSCAPLDREFVNCFTPRSLSSM